MNPSQKAATLLALAKAVRDLTLAADAIACDITLSGSALKLKDQALSNYLVGGLMQVGEKLDAARELASSALTVHKAFRS